MKLAIMQPYFIPYIGYWQLMNSVDKFVVYDNIQFSKKGWFHRNRILINGNDKLITLPLKKDSDYLDVKDRYLSSNKNDSIQKHLRIINQSYSKAPYFNSVFPLIKDIFNYDNDNLLEYIINSILKIKKYLNIDTEIIMSSTVPINHIELKGQSKVIEITKYFNAKNYINTSGGKNLYNKQHFLNEDINLQFIEAKLIKYKQFSLDFIPFLSIIDVMMFNDLNEIEKMLNEYTLQ